MKRGKCLLSLALCALLLLGGLPVSAAGEEAGTVVRLRTAADLRALAESCSLDAWSRDKTVVLERDIDLSGADFAPIPSFGGVFDGGGHCILGLSVTGAYAPAGLISMVQPGARIQDLTVCGALSPSGVRTQVGGVAGVNRGTLLNVRFEGTAEGESQVGGVVGVNEAEGKLCDCQAAGSVTGGSAVGGVAGLNRGSVSGCQNEAAVNAVSRDPVLRLDALSLPFNGEEADLSAAGAMNMATDTGGIAGVNEGLLLSCLNEGTVGYPHIGYNVGGAAGRSTGYLSGCRNRGPVYGRKDVGGIVGQMEPCVTLRFSEDSLMRLRTELHSLFDLVSAAAGRAEQNGDALSARLGSLAAQTEDAVDSAHLLAEDLTDYGDSAAAAFNRISDVAADAVSRLAEIAEDAAKTVDAARPGLAALEDGLQALSQAAGFGKEALTALQPAADALAEAAALGGSGAESLLLGLDTLRGALRADDPAAAKRALRVLDSGLSSLLTAFSDLSGGLSQGLDSLRQSGFVDDALTALRDGGLALSALSGALADLREALGAASAAVDTDWDQLTLGLDRLDASFAAASEAAADLGSAMTAAQTGAAALSAGLRQLTDAVTVSDPQAVMAALDDLQAAFRALGAASSAMGQALAALTAALAATDPVQRADGLAAAMAAASDAAISAGQVYTLFDDAAALLAQGIQLDSGKAGSGARLALDGLSGLGDAAGRMGDGLARLTQAGELARQGLSALRQSLVVNDPAALSAAMADVDQALADATGAVGGMGGAVAALATALRGAWQLETLDPIVDALRDTGEALKELRHGAAELARSWNPDLSAAAGALDPLREGAEALRQSLGAVETALRAFSGSLVGFAGASGSLETAFQQLSTAADSFTDASGSLLSLMLETWQLFTYLDGVEPVQLPLPSEALRTQGAALYDTVSGLTQQAALLSAEGGDAVGETAADLRAISEQCRRTGDAMLDAVGVLAQTDAGTLTRDASEDYADTLLSGRTRASVNYGQIRGDLNVGGIVGAISVESIQDPEKDLASQSGFSLSPVYEFMAVVQRCGNRGEVTAKRDYAGGVCGRAYLGFLQGCEGYGPVASEGGDFVGGIAGLTDGSIRDCWAKCALRGGSYVGGVAGRAAVVADCRSLVEITAGAQFLGAVSGSPDGVFSGNLFVSGQLAGADRYSYAGGAEPVDYAILAALPSLPPEFQQFTLEFRAEGTVLKTLRFPYGAQPSPAVYPPLPEKPGCYAGWDTAALPPMTFDRVVNAVYTAAVSAIPSTSQRADERAVFLAEGSFRPGGRVAADQLGGAAPEGIPGGVTLTDYLACLGERLPLPYVNLSLLERWKIALPADGEGAHRLHYLPPEGQRQLAVYIRDGQGWTLSDAQWQDSYLVLTIPGDAAELAVLSAIPALWLLPAAAGAALLCLLVTALALRRLRRKRARRG